jgi:hypothetical protein
MSLLTKVRKKFEDPGPGSIHLNDLLHTKELVFSDGYFPGYGNIQPDQYESYFRAVVEMKILEHAVNSNITYRGQNAKVAEQRYKEACEKVKELKAKLSPLQTARLEHAEFLKFCLGQTTDAKILQNYAYHFSRQSNYSASEAFQFIRDHLTQHGNLPRELFLDTNYASMIEGVSEEIMQIYDRHFEILKCLLSIEFKGPQNIYELKVYYKYFLNNNIFKQLEDKAKLYTRIYILPLTESRPPPGNDEIDTAAKNMNITDQIHFIFWLYGHDYLQALEEDVAPILNNEFKDVPGGEYTTSDRTFVRSRRSNMNESAYPGGADESFSSVKRTFQQAQNSVASSMEQVRSITKKVLPPLKNTPKTPRTPAKETGQSENSVDADAETEADPVDGPDQFSSAISQRTGVDLDDEYKSEHASPVVAAQSQGLLGATMSYASSLFGVKQTNNPSKSQPEPEKKKIDPFQILQPNTKFKDEYMDVQELETNYVARPDMPSQNTRGKSKKLQNKEANPSYNVSEKPPLPSSESQTPAKKSPPRAVSFAGKEETPEKARSDPNNNQSENLLGPLPMESATPLRPVLDARNKSPGSSQNNRILAQLSPIQQNAADQNAPMNVDQNASLPEMVQVDEEIDISLPVGRNASFNSRLHSESQEWQTDPDTDTVTETKADENANVQNDSTSTVGPSASRKDRNRSESTEVEVDEPSENQPGISKKEFNDMIFDYINTGNDLKASDINRLSPAQVETYLAIRPLRNNITVLQNQKEELMSDIGNIDNQNQILMEEHAKLTKKIADRNAEYEVAYQAQQDAQKQILHQHQQEVQKETNFLEKTVNEIQRQRRALEQAEREHAQALKDQTHEMEQLQGKLANLQREIEEGETMQNLKVKLLEKEQYATAIDLAMKTAEDRYMQIINGIEQQAQQKMDSAINKAMGEYEKKIEQVQAGHAEELANEKKKTGFLQSKAEEQRKTIQQLQSDILKTGDERSQLNDQIMAQLEEIRIKDNEIDALQQSIQKNEQLVKTLKHNETEAKNSLERFQRDLASKEDDINLKIQDKTNKLTKFQNNLLQLQQAVTRQNEQNAEQIRKIDQLTRDIKTKEAEIAQLQNDKQTAEPQLQELERLKIEHHRLNQELLQKNEQTATQSQRIDVLTRNIQKKEAEITQLQNTREQEASNLQQQIVQSNAQLEQIRAEQQQALNALRDKDTQLEELRQSTAQMTQTTQQLHQQIETLQAQNIEQNTTLNEKLAELGVSKELYTNLKAQLDQLKMEHQQVLQQRAQEVAQSNTERAETLRSQQAENHREETERIHDVSTELLNLAFKKYEMEINRVKSIHDREIEQYNKHLQESQHAVQELERQYRIMEEKLLHDGRQNDMLREENATLEKNLKESSDRVGALSNQIAEIAAALPPVSAPSNRPATTVQSTPRLVVVTPASVASVRTGRPAPSPSSSIATPAQNTHAPPQQQIVLQNSPNRTSVRSAPAAQPSSSNSTSQSRAQTATPASTKSHASSNLGLNAMFSQNQPRSVQATPASSQSRASSDMEIVSMHEPNQPRSVQATPASSQSRASSDMEIVSMHEPNQPRSVQATPARPINAANEIQIYTPKASKIVQSAAENNALLQNQSFIDAVEELQMAEIEQEYLQNDQNAVIQQMADLRDITQKINLQKRQIVEQISNHRSNQNQLLVYRENALERQKIATQSEEQKLNVAKTQIMGAKDMQNLETIRYHEQEKQILRQQLEKERDEAIKTETDRLTALFQKQAQNYLDDFQTRVDQLNKDKQEFELLKQKKDEEIKKFNEDQQQQYAEYKETKKQNQALAEQVKIMKEKTSSQMYLDLQSAYQEAYKQKDEMHTKLVREQALNKTLLQSQEKLKKQVNYLAEGRKKDSDDILEYQKYYRDYERMNQLYKDTKHQLRTFFKRDNLHQVAYDWLVHKRNTEEAIKKSEDLEDKVKKLESDIEYKESLNQKDRKEFFEALARAQDPSLQESESAKKLIELQEELAEAKANFKQQESERIVSNSKYRRELAANYAYLEKQNIELLQKERTKMQEELEGIKAIANAELRSNEAQRVEHEQNMAKLVTTHKAETDRLKNEYASEKSKLNETHEEELKQTKRRLKAKADKYVDKELDQMRLYLDHKKQHMQNEFDSHYRHYTELLNHQQQQINTFTEIVKENYVQNPNFNSESEFAANRQQLAQNLMDGLQKMLASANKARDRLLASGAIDRQETEKMDQNLLLAISRLADGKKEEGNTADYDNVMSIYNQVKLLAEDRRNYHKKMQRLQYAIDKDTMSKKEDEEFKLAAALAEKKYNTLVDENISVRDENSRLRGSIVTLEGQYRLLEASKKTIELNLAKTEKYLDVIQKRVKTPTNQQELAAVDAQHENQSYLLKIDSLTKENAAAQKIITELRKQLLEKDEKIHKERNMEGVSIGGLRGAPPVLPSSNLAARVVVPPSQLSVENNLQEAYGRQARAGHRRVHFHDEG